MQIPVLVEPIDGRGFRARGAEPFALCAEGATREEALGKLQEQLQARLRQGAAIVPLEVSAAPHPLAEFAGMFKDDPDFQEVIEIMAENRRQLDADDSRP